jgi:acyl-coenzyme A synthetase/AMP-(fatty) acid ligase
MVSGTPDGHRDDDIADAVRRTLAERGVVASPIFVEHVDSIPKSASGKALLIRCTQALRILLCRQAGNACVAGPTGCASADHP